jgi:hypothetical protein
LKPGIVKGEGEEFTYLVMPVRLPHPSAEFPRGRMRLLWVELKDFRNHEDTRLDVPDGLVVRGRRERRGKDEPPRGHVLPLRVELAARQRDASTRAFGASSAFVRGEVQAGDARVSDRGGDPSSAASKLQVNRSPLRRKRELRRQVRAVFFGPEDLDVVRGDPSHRRRFLDEAVVTLWPLTRSELRAYERALRQRNRLLKEWEGRGAPAELEAWDAELVKTGSAVIRARAAAIEKLAPLADEEFERLSATVSSARTRRTSGETRSRRRSRKRLAERRSDELIREDLARRTAPGRRGARGPRSRGAELRLSRRGLGAALCLRLGLAEPSPQRSATPPWFSSTTRSPRSTAEAATASRRASRARPGGDLRRGRGARARNADAIWDVRAGAVAERAAGAGGG